MSRLTAQFVRGVWSFDVMALPFPAIDPVLVSIGPLSVRWYALAYLAGFVLAWQYMQYLARQYPKGPSAKQCDDFLTYGILGTILGGRLGYVLFYQLDAYLQDPVQIFYIWRGGMSFHGGMLGVIAAAILYARREKLPFFALSDVLAAATPIGLGLGRIANFINGELYGRVTDVPWAVIFPRGGDMPRHPSQLYESFFEGLVLFVVLYVLARRASVRARTGLLSGAFLCLYALFRFGAEFFREPDVQIGYLALGTTMGQILCIPMFLYGAFVLYQTRRRAHESS